MTRVITSVKREDGSGKGPYLSHFFKQESIMPFFWFIWFVLQTTLIKKSNLLLPSLLLLLVPVVANCQTIIKGKVTDNHHSPIPYASVSLKNSTDGSTTDSTGNFSLAHRLKGTRCYR